MTRRPFEEQMAETEGLVVHMASMVSAQLERAVTALSTRDVALAQQIVDGDAEINAMYAELEHSALRVLALQAPVAGDLRLVSAILHINQHLERMGDLIVNVAKFVRKTQDFPGSALLTGEATEMGNLAGKMLETAIQAFVNRDLESALHLATMDDAVDRLNRTIIKQVAAWGEAEGGLEWAMRLLLVSRHLERVGDNAVDIGKNVAFMITGDLNAHRPLEAN